MNSKIILLPIKVPNNLFCWDFHTPCEHFDNDGPITCSHHMYPQEDARGYGYMKPAECSKLVSLKQIKELLDNIPKDARPSFKNGYKTAVIDILELLNDK